jgi:hypothetical protein
MSRIFCIVDTIVCFDMYHFVRFTELTWALKLAQKSMQMLNV